MIEFPDWYRKDMAPPPDEPQTTGTHVVEAAYAEHACLLAALFPRLTVEALPLVTEHDRQRAALLCARTAGLLSLGENGVPRGIGDMSIEHVVNTFMPRLTDGKHGVIRCETADNLQTAAMLNVFGAMVKDRCWSENERAVPPDYPIGSINTL
jgi:hypothetical protein